MSHVPQLTRSDRAGRRGKIILGLRSGASTAEIAARHNVSPCWVRQIGSTAGVQFKRGRPRDQSLALPPDDAALYAKVRRLYGAAYARELLGIGA